MKSTYVGAALDEIGREMRRKRSKPSVYEGWTEGQPRECYVCGKPVRISKDDCGFRTAEPRLTWHFSCAKGAPLRLGE